VDERKLGTLFQGKFITTDTILREISDCPARELSDITLFGSRVHPRTLGTRNIKITEKISPIYSIRGGCLCKHRQSHNVIIVILESSQHFPPFFLLFLFNKFFYSWNSWSPQKFFISLLFERSYPAFRAEPNSTGISHAEQDDPEVMF
jgi:hypothetical protein